MPLNLSARELARLTGQTAKTTPKKKSVPSVPVEKQEPGIPTGPVTHKQIKTMDGKFGSNAPVKDSLALCRWDGRRWQVCVYLECGTARFEMRDSEFGDYFREERG